MLPITFRSFIGPAFNSDVINAYCDLIDSCHDNLMKCNDHKEKLLHFMHNAIDVKNPLNKDYIRYFSFVKESIQ